MIHRQNYLDVRAYLHYCAHGRQASTTTVSRYRSALLHLLTWADDVPLPDVRRRDPAFPAYLLTARIDGKSKPLAPPSTVKILQCARQFMQFARNEWPLRYKSITPSWIDLLQPPRKMRAESRLPNLQIYTLEEAQAVASVSVETLREERARMAFAMLFLSGIRPDALASLPISCVDLPARQIMQLPEMGVRTKNSKAARTFLLEIPVLLDVVEAWDARVRQALPAEALWYATLTSDGMAITPTLHAHVGRNKVVEEDVRLICQRADLPYLPPKQLRHSHIVWALKNARNMADLKAISQNVMHSTVVITDGTYGNLVRDDVRDAIARLGQSQTGDESLEAKIDRLLKALEQR
jgi:integrase